MTHVVVWDFGGVLFRWRPAALLERVLPRRVVDDASARHWLEAVFQSYSNGDWIEFDRGTLDAETLIGRLVARTGLGPDEARAIVDRVPEELQPIDGSVALLATLRNAGRRQFFLSNMPAPYADHLERTHDFVRWFEDGVFSSRVKFVKPDPAIFALAARRFGVPRSELLFVDDYAANVAAARDAGWNALRFSDAAACAAELRRLGVLD
jgi:putative hydrolase of the HAD superfamily